MSNPVEMAENSDVSKFRRPAHTVMRLDRLGCSHPTRLSFLRTLVRRVQGERWSFSRTHWEIDGRGVGRAVYTVCGPQRAYSLVAFSHDLPPEMRSDRVIATAWDATFTLYDGVPAAADIDRLERNVPLQEEGRLGARELTLSRANRSVRLFEHVVSRLAGGQQPDLSEIDQVGYLMRTTAVYGSGKFGAADRADISGRPELNGPFQVEMLTVWLIRQFTVDIAEHMAKARGGAIAVALDADIKRRLGVGNSTGLGMAPFLIRHPTLLNNWIAAREEALARVRAQRSANSGAVRALGDEIVAGRLNAELWRSDHAIQQGKLVALRDDLGLVERYVSVQWNISEPYPWNQLWTWGEENLSTEGQEALLGLMLEVHGDLVDDLSCRMSVNDSGMFPIRGAQTVGEFRREFLDNFQWALDMDMSSPASSEKFWYVSAEKLEPRLGLRATEPGADKELPLASAPACHSLAADLHRWRGADTVAAFLASHPAHRAMVRRAQIAADYPFSEVRDNLVDAGMLPIDLLRCKLAFFGATRFDPRSDLWVRISLFQGMDYPSDLQSGNERDSSVEGIRVSRSEVESIAVKACRGAGFAWGVAEEMGLAVRRLVESDVEGFQILLDYLTWRESHRDDAGSDAVTSPVNAGVMLIDGADRFRKDRKSSVTYEVTHPLILAGFAMRAAQMAAVPLKVRWEASELVLDAEGGLIGRRGSMTTTNAASVTIECISDETVNGARIAEMGAFVSRRIWDDLCTFSLRTTVPATDASRNNAGAGVTDND